MHSKEEDPGEQQKPVRFGTSFGSGPDNSEHGHGCSDDNAKNPDDEFGKKAGHSSSPSVHSLQRNQQQGIVNALGRPESFKESWFNRSWQNP